MEHIEHIAAIKQYVVKLCDQCAMWLFDHHVQLSHMVTVIFCLSQPFIEGKCSHGWFHVVKTDHFSKQLPQRREGRVWKSIKIAKNFRL